MEPARTSDPIVERIDLDATSWVDVVRGFVTEPDVLHDVVAERTGGHTRFINQRDQDYLPSAFMEDSYRKQFTNAESATSA